MSLERQPKDAGLSPYLLLQCGTATVIFRPWEVLEAQHPALLQNLSRHPFGVGLQLELNCADLPTIQRTIERAGWPISYELEDKQHLRRELWIHDPDGYLVVLNEENASFI